MRLGFLRERGECLAVSVATPIVYRSHLFSPIARENPSFLLDVLNLSSENPVIAHKNVHYHAIRYCICMALSQSGSGGGDSEKAEHTAEDSDSTQSLTRVFLSVVDCNFDYSYPVRFRTASRLIVEWTTCACPAT